MPKSTYTELVDVIPWKSAEEQRFMLDNLCRSIDECIAVYERFEQPATKNSHHRSYIKFFIPNLTIFAHIASFFNCQAERGRDQLRKNIFLHTVIEVCWGHRAYDSGGHTLSHHIGRVFTQKYYHYPPKKTDLTDALQQIVFHAKPRKGGTFSKETKVLINLLSSEYTLKVRFLQMDYEHLVSKRQCKKWLDAGHAVDKNNIGNCGLLDLYSNRAKKCKDIVENMESHSGGVRVHAQDFRARWLCSPTDVRRGQSNPANFRMFIKARQQNIFDALLKLPEIIDL